MYVGEEVKDMCIQKAFGILKKRGYTGGMSEPVYYRLLGVLDRDGEDALYRYASTVNF